MTTKKSSINEARNVASKKTAVWLPWSKSNKHVWKPAQAGVGPGEEMVAWEINGMVQGGSVSYDVVTKDGQKWEVKMPVSRVIKAGVEGQRATAHAIKNINAVVQQIVTVFSSTDISVLDSILDEEDSKMLDALMNFIAVDAPAILESGNLSVGRILGGTHKNPIGLKQILFFVNDLILRGTGEPTDVKSIEFANKDRKVGISTYVRVGKVLNVPEEEIDVAPADIFRGQFTHYGFRNPMKFIEDNWSKGIRASTVFGGTDGVILVKPDGYMILPLKQLDSSMRLYSIVQGGRPMFKIEVY